MSDDTVRQSYLRWLAEEDSTHQQNYIAYREYYDGDHNTQLTARQREFLQVKMGVEFNINYCQVVVDAVVERLAVTGFTVEDEAQAKLLWEWWNVNRMDGEQGIIHHCGVLDGDTYLIVEWDNDEEVSRLLPQPAYDGAEGVKVHYSKEKRNVIEFASKRWRVDQGPEAGYMRRVNLYFPDRVEKFFSHEKAYDGNWQQYREPGQPWPLPWVNPDTGEPLGVPVFHFKNRDQGNNYGTSELKCVIPPQNALNKTALDLIAAADTTAFRVHWMTGETPTGMSIAPGSWIYTESPDASVGYFPGEDLQGLINLKDTFVSSIARVSRTPLSYFQVTGQIAAEGTQKQQEAGLVAKVKKCQVDFGNGYENAMAMARKLANAFGGAGLDEEQTISTEWADPQTRNEREHLETLKIKSELGVPTEQVWAEMGYNAEQIAEMKAQRGEELAQTSNVGGELLRAFERGEVAE